MAGDLDRAEGWTGLRPMTPDGTPVIGPTRYPNLFLNTGHGTLGWTMACGSGRAVADVVVGKTPEISLDGLTAARYGKAPWPDKRRAAHGGSGRSRAPQTPARRSSNASRLPAEFRACTNFRSHQE